MPNDLLFQGRRLSAPELAQVQRWLAAHPAWHRTRLSRELCALWNWRKGAGQFKDVACRQAGGLPFAPAPAPGPWPGSASPATRSSAGDRSSAGVIWAG